MKTVKSKLTIFALTAFVAVAMTLCSGLSAFAQEGGEPIVVDSVIAQVNSDIIMLSSLKREMKDAVESFKRQGMPEQKANEEVTRRQAEIIANLVDELLLVQKGKELSLTDDVEKEVNAEMLRVMKEQGFKAIAEMEEAMRKEGIDPAEIRQTLRTQYMKNAVLSSEVDAKIYNNITTPEAKDYFEKHKDKFRKPEVVTISEIFLSLAGKPEAEVRAKADQIVAQLRSGADFKTLAAANSERLDQAGNRVAVQSGGKVGTFTVPDLRPEFVNALKNVAAGGVSDPIRIDEGFEILRVDERTPAGDVSTFDENKVREAITIERRDKEREAYMKTLRKDAYIKLAKEYEPTVAPILGITTATPTTASDSTAPDAKGKGKKSDKNKKP
ncbi:MAG TPA: peptidyl-prolyl cis-trans isomerase [Pyrinomonadaceae bacterium]|nr:peptidyl-prolyl cis-trans isomerase [Pyrinomonadaceae bacterium]